MARLARLNAPRPRTAAREQRREELIQATIRSIAKLGIAATTMAEVTREAGLSLGIVNLHFESKEKLFIETLRYLADEYKAGWERALARAGQSPVERLAALVALDFSPRVCDRRKLAVWFAFWGEARARPTYLKLCKQRDQEYDAVLLEICRELVSEGGYARVDPEIVAAGLSALTDGLWLDLLISSSPLDPKRAQQICLAYLASYFPGHFLADTSPSEPSPGSFPRAQN